MPLQNGDAFALECCALADARRKIEFQGVDRPLNHRLVGLGNVAAKELHRLLFPSVRNHGAGPDRLEGLHAVVFERNAGEFEAALKQGLLVLAHRLGIVDGIDVHKLERQFAVARLGHALQQGFNLPLEALPFLGQRPREVARHQHIVLQTFEQLNRAWSEGVALFSRQIHRTVHQLSQHKNHRQHCRGQGQ